MTRKWLRSSITVLLGVFVALAIWNFMPTAVFQAELADSHAGSSSFESSIHVRDGLHSAGDKDASGRFAIFSDANAAFGADERSHASEFEFANCRLCSKDLVRLLLDSSGRGFPTARAGSFWTRCFAIGCAGRSRAARRRFRRPRGVGRGRASLGRPFAGGFDCGFRTETEGKGEGIFRLMNSLRIDS
jgi:hypothetical protein